MAEFNEIWHNDSIEGVVNASFSIYKKRVLQRPQVEDCILAKIQNLAVQTWTYVDPGSIETVWQNSMRLGTTIVWMV